MKRLAIHFPQQQKRYTWKYLCLDSYQLEIKSSRNHYSLRELLSVGFLLSNNRPSDLQFTNQFSCLWYFLSSITPFVLLSDNYLGITSSSFTVLWFSFLIKNHFPRQRNIPCLQLNRGCLLFKVSSLSQTILLQ